MDKVNFLRVQVIAFRLMGYDLWQATDVNDRPVISMSVIGPMSAFMVPVFFAIKLNITNVSIISDSMSSLLAITLTLVKYGVFKYYRGDFVQLIHRIRGILEKQIADCPDVYDIVEKENRSDQKLSLTYMRSFFVAFLFAGIKPILLMVASKLKTGRTQLELPHSAVYAWSDQSLWWYIPTYIWNLLTSYGAVNMSLAMDTLLFALTYNVSAVFRIAQYRIKALQPLKDEPRQELYELVDVLNLHQTALLIATELGHSLKPLIFMQFLVTAVQLCFLGFQLADHILSPEGIYFIFFIGSVLIALFIYSHCGENMKQASVEFANAAYACNWEEFSPATRRLLILTIMRSQRPSQLQGYFFEPNMATFSAVVRSAISYVMMLRSFNTTDKP